MKRPFPVILAMVLCLMPLFPESDSPLFGVWSNGSRFVEFAPDGRMRFVLKTYYGFVYEDRAWLPYSATPLAFAANVASATADTVADAATATVDEPTATPGARTDGVTGDDQALREGAFVLSLRYPKEKADAEIPLAVIGDAIYFRFFRKADPATMVANANANANAATLRDAPAPAPDARGPLDGFWIAAGNQDALKLYRSEAISEFFTYYFSGSDYYRIRYWATDARPRDVGARFVSRDGAELYVPKFIAIGTTLYTCVTSTGKVLRNYESGSFEATDGSLSFTPSAIVYSGTAAAILKPLEYTLSGDGTILALGNPYLARSKVADLSSEIAAHNALRRPPRKPIFGFMKLDFHWDEIERIRNNGKMPEGDAGK